MEKIIVKQDSKLVPSLIHFLIENQTVKSLKYCLETEQTQ